MNNLLILLIIFFSFSPLVKFIHLLIILVFIIFYYFFKEIKIQKKKKYLLILFLLFLMTHYYFKEIIFTSGNLNLKKLFLNTETILKFILSFFLAQLIRDKELFFKQLEKIIFIFCILSLFIFILQLLNFEILYKMPSVKIARLHSIFIQNFIPNREGIFLKRNSGIAWEPGAFQFLINIGLFLNLKIKQNKYIYKNIIYIIAILTTFSTTGILILLIQILNLIKKFCNKKNFIKGVIGFGIFSIIVYSDINLERGIVNRHIVKKINLKNKDGSTLERKKHFEMDILSFKKNFFIGRGAINYQKDRNEEVSSNSYTRILAIYGTFFFLFYISNLIVGIKKNINREWIMFALIVLLTFTNEIIWTSPLVLIFIFMEKNNENKIV